MKSKIKGKTARIPSPFDTTIHKTEPTAVAVLMHWMREIIEKENIDLGPPDVETTGADRKKPDAVIYESRRSQNVLCVIEAKAPYYDVFDEKELKKPAWEKANQRKARYFATTNFKKLIWFDTRKTNELASEEQQIVNKYNLSEIENLDEIEQANFSEPIKRGLKSFLIELYEVHNKKKTIPKQAIDEFLVLRLQEKIRVLAKYYKRIIDDKCHKDTSFKQTLKKWFIEQGWNFTMLDSDFEKAARQTAYLLINKILFYDLLQAKRPGDLDPLDIPDSLTKGELLQTTLQGYFKQVLKIDYETIYTTDFIDTQAFPDQKEVVKEIRELINVLKRYDFSKIRYEIIGRIFEQLIPPDERHNLGQYFTNPDIVDLILRFCHHHEDDKVLDPACGAGTFLVRAYQHKVLMNQRKEHQDLLDTLWGVDIAKFPAHLSTINLAINKLEAGKNYPNIIKDDFFALLMVHDGFEAPETWRKTRAVTLGIEEREITYPRWFDLVIGNPPYTRQEEIPDIGVDKQRLIDSALKDPSGRKIAEIGRRAGIHSYFFVHGTKFLKDGGHFGFIVSDSWLDADYGKGLQEFFLGNHKIIAIIASKIERWFAAADINTCIVILQKCKDKKARDENIVRFVYLKTPLRSFIPPAQDMWEKQVTRRDEVDKLKKTILGHSDFYENDELRIYPKKQNELWEEGYDRETRDYIGSKWGKYLRAPAIFFRILEKGKGKLVPLKEIADVRFGIKTGANKFFYLTEEEIKNKKIEKEFWMHKDKKGKWVPDKVFVKANELRKPIVEPSLLRYNVLFINKHKEKLNGTNILRYINKGQQAGYNQRPTCATREPGRPWFDLGENIDDIIAFPERIRMRHIVFYNPERIALNKNLYGVEPRTKSASILIALVLNSTLTAFYSELFARQPGGGGGPLDIDVYVAAATNIPSLDCLKKFKNKIRRIKILDRPIDNIIAEIGASSPEKASLDKIKPDRRELDKIIMGNILGLTDEEQLEVYKAVIDLVKSRIEKAKSVEKQDKAKDGVNINALKKIIVEQIEKE